MQIIDAHLHLFAAGSEADEMARAVGLENSTAYLKDYFAAHDFTHGIVMSNRSLNPARHCYPDFLHYCIGLDGIVSGHYDAREMEALVEANLERPNCVGIKLYPGYHPVTITDPCFDFVYRLAEKYDKPVAVHTGMTAHPRASLRHCHPLTMDEAAVRHPNVQFIMCHFGNPFLSDAAAVLEKCPNVAADLSGLLEGPIHLQAYLQEQSGYVFLLKTWIAYVCDYRRFLFGTDFPAVNFSDYASFIQTLIPKQHWADVFFNNANRIYHLGLPTGN
ncbi:MAG: TatD family hydrolase [Oscillospiraceae bacterium]|nr:TatD family hydrolase [Oscillospiraceae bacterium]